MFDDIIKQKNDCDVIRKDLLRYLDMINYPIDFIQIRYIAYGIISYFNAYHDISDVDVTFDKDFKKITIEFDNKTMIFPLGK